MRPRRSIEATEADPLIPFAEQVRQLGNIRRYAPRLIERISVAVDVGESLSVGAHDLEAAV